MFAQVVRRRLLGEAFRDFFSDLFAGDLVAIAIVVGFLLFLAVIAVLGAWFIWQRKRTADAFRQRVAEKRKKEKGEYKASKKAKEI
jgi:hypothetical protein